MIIVDTNVVAEMMKPSPDPSVVSWLNDQEAGGLFLTTVTIGEIGFGLEILPQGKRRLHLEEGFERVIAEATADVKAGLPLSEAFRKHPEIPGIIVAMIKIGEETGNMGNILETMARFYRREVNNAVDTMVGLIEPLMIVILALGVAVLLAAVLLPIYNIASSF